MRIVAEGLGKKYNYDWIFRGLDYTFEENQDYAVIGSNGSGKSTLIKVLSSFILQTEGKVQYLHDGKSLEVESVFKYMSISAPYLELIEEFTLRDIYKFHFKFKTPLLSFEEFIERLRLKAALNKEIKFFSSGMKQRLKLGLAFFSAGNVMFLDEPTTNLDIQGIDWYLSEVSQMLGKRTLFICSNQQHEYEFCRNVLDVEKLSFK